MRSDAAHKVSAPVDWGSVRIYGLTEPGTKLVRYVGIARNPRQRLESHLSEARNAERRGRVKPKDRWLSGLLAADKVPGLVILEALEGPRYYDHCGSTAAAYVVEKEWIQILLTCGVDLLNVRNTPRDRLVPYGMQRGTETRRQFLADARATVERDAKRASMPTLAGFLYPVPGLPPAALLDPSEPLPLTAAALRANWAQDPR